MTDRQELFFKFAFLFSGLVLFMAMVYASITSPPNAKPVEPEPTSSVSPSPKE